MSKPRYRWWGYALKVVRAYPKLLAADCLTEDDQKDRDAVSRAIELTRECRHGAEILQLMKWVYWDRSVPRLKDAAQRLYVSENTVNRRHREFIQTVGKCLGFSVAAANGDAREQKKEIAG